MKPSQGLYIIDRRKLIVYAGAGLLAETFPLIAQATPATAFELIYPYDPINRQLATCQDYNQLLRQLEAAKSKIGNGWEVEATQMIKDYSKARDQWKVELQQAESATTKAETEKFIAATALAAGLILSVLGAVVTSELAIGAVVGASILIGPTILVLQAISLPQSQPSSIVFGYSLDRIFTLSELAGAEAKSSAGRLIGKASTFIALSLSALAISKAGNDVQEALARARNARSQLLAIESAIEKFGSNKAMWINMREKALSAAISSITRYVSLTREQNCIVLVGNGPVIKPLP